MALNTSMKEMRKEISQRNEEWDIVCNNEGTKSKPQGIELLLCYGVYMYTLEDNGLR